MLELVDVYCSFTIAIAVMHYMFTFDLFETKSTPMLCCAILQPLYKRQ